MTMPRIDFHLCDCMDFMRGKPDRFYDLAIVDPPYGGGGKEDKPFSGGASRFGGLFDRYGAREWRDAKPMINVEDGGIFARYERHPDKEMNDDAPSDNPEENDDETRNIDFWDYAPPKEYFDELFRVSKNQIIWGGNYFALPPTRCFLVWRKLSISERFSMAMAEYAWTSFNANAKVFEKAPQGTAKEMRFHPCLPEGTKVWFNGEWKDIKEVKVGDGNEFGRVSATSEHWADKMVEISAGGRNVTATWNHPFLLLRGMTIAWVEAEQIRKGDEILCVKETTKSLKRATCGIDWMPQDASVWSIASFGRSIMAGFLKACKFITRTSTRRTIALRTSSLSLPLSTSGFTKVADLSTGYGSSHARSAASSNPAMRSTGILAGDGFKDEYVENALSEKSSRTVVCELLTVGSARTIHERTKVYNLTMDGVPAFETECGITHNTQKPVELYEWCISLFAEKGWRLLDTHGGSCSSAIAAYNLGYEMDVCEINRWYYAKAKERFEKETRQMMLPI